MEDKLRFNENHLIKATKNGQSIDTGNIEHKTQNEGI